MLTELISFIRDRLKPKAEGAAYLYHKGAETLDIVVATKDHEDAIYNLVFLLEDELADRFPDFAFNFYIWAHQGRGATTVLPSSFVRLWEIDV